MSEAASISAALDAAGLCADVSGARDLSGGCIHRVKLLTLGDGQRVVAKIASPAQLALLAEERAGLQALADTGTVLVPEPRGEASVFGSRAVLLMEAIDPGVADAEAWGRFGRELAALHAADAGRRYGFAADNHLGTTPQPNRWCDDWIEFNRVHRLGFQLGLARRHGRLTADELDRLERLVDGLDRLLPAAPRPSLLHGDLWSGNALTAAGGRVAVIDPACSVGDGWADIAMMRLFGGFPAACFEAHAEAVRERAKVEPRITVYQLYHVLNHVNLFGRAYAGQAMALASRLG